MFDFFFLNRVSLWPGTHCVTQTFNSTCLCLPPHPYCYLAVYCLLIYVFCQGFTLKSRSACLVLTKRLRLDSSCHCLKSAETTSVGLQSTHWAEIHPSRTIFQQVEESRERRKRLEEGPILEVMALEKRSLQYHSKKEKLWRQSEGF